MSVSWLQVTADATHSRRRRPS